MNILLQVFVICIACERAI